VTANPPSQAVQWEFIESGEGTGPSVTVTPHVTGRILVQALVNVTNPTGGAISFSAVLSVNTVASGPISGMQVPAGQSGSLSLIFLFEEGTGTAINYGVFVSGDGLLLGQQASFLSAQEVSVPQ